MYETSEVSEVIKIVQNNPEYDYEDKGHTILISFQNQAIEIESIDMGKGCTLKDPSILYAHNRVLTEIF